MACRSGVKAWEIVVDKIVEISVDRVLTVMVVLRQLRGLITRESEE